MTDYIQPTTERLQWARIHPDAAHLGDLIGNLAEREGWESRERTTDALHALTTAADALSRRAAEAGVPRIGSTGDVLPSWAMVAQPLRAWDAREATVGPCERGAQPLGSGDTPRRLSVSPANR